MIHTNSEKSPITNQLWPIDICMHSSSNWRLCHQGTQTVEFL